MSRVADAGRTTFRSLKVRNFRLFFFGQLISQVGNWLTTIALTLLVLHETQRGLAIGALVACQFGPMLLLGAYGGVVADRSDKRRLLLITQVLQMLQSFTLATIAFADHPPLAAYYVTALAGGLVLAFDNPARRSFVPEMVPEDQMHNAVTLNSALMTSSRIFGPALAGLLVITVGYAWTFLVDGLSYLAVIAAYLLMRPSELRQPPRTPRAKGQVREGLRYVRDVPDLLIPLVMVAIIGTLTFNFSVVMPLFVEHTLGGDDRAYTVMYSVLSVGSFTGALITAHRQSVDTRHVVRAAFGFGVAMLTFAAMPTLVWAFPVALLVGLASVTFMATATAIVQVRADPAMRGRVLALQAMVMIGSTPIGGPIMGAVSDAWGTRTAIVIGGVGALGAAAYGRAAGRRTAARLGSGPADDAATLTSEVPAT